MQALCYVWLLMEPANTFCTTVKASKTPLRAVQECVQKVLTCIYIYYHVTAFCSVLHLCNSKLSTLQYKHLNVAVRTKIWAIS